MAMAGLPPTFETGKQVQVDNVVPYLRCSSDVEHTGNVLDANDKSKDRDKNSDDNNDFLKGKKTTWEKSTSIFHYKNHFLRNITCLRVKPNSMSFTLPLV